MKKHISIIIVIAMIITSMNLSLVQTHAAEMTETQEGTSDLDESADDSSTVNDGVSVVEEGQGDIPDAGVEEPVSDENGTDAQAESESDPETEDRANSWRYTDGEPDMPVSGKARSRALARINAVHPNATRKGIDVSKWQGNIDWAKVKESGVEFAIIRCGFGQDYAAQDDEYFWRNVSECERLGIPYGVYLYSYAKDKLSAASEARHVIRLLQGRKLSYPVYLDMEDNSTIAYKARFGDIAETFCTAIRNAGYAVGVYANYNWWTTYLTDSRFANWHKWVAQYNTSCWYQGTYAMWQYSSSETVPGITGTVDMNFLIGYPKDHGAAGTISSGIQYEAHVQDIGWQSAVGNGATAGTTGQNKKVEALKIKLAGQKYTGGVEYSTYVEGAGWQSYVSDGQISGTVGKNKKVEAVSVRLKGDMANQYDVYFRVHSSDIGWQGWTKNGEKAGTEGLGKKVEAVQIQLVSKGGSAPGSTDNAFQTSTSSNPSNPSNPDTPNQNAGISYSAHVQDIGWQKYVSNGQLAGTTGRNKQVEALKIKLTNADSGGVKYRAHVEDIGWQNFVETDKVSGTEGKNKHVEAIEIQLTGEMEKQYDIYYRVHSSDFGWFDWAKNGGQAGSEGYGKQVEALEIRLVKKGGRAPGATAKPFVKKEAGGNQGGQVEASAEIQYRAHVQDIGWQGYVSNGTLAGTTGRNKQLEAIRIKLANSNVEGSIQYKAHVEDIGWQNYVSADSVSGTVGKNKHMEAIAIQLTGEMKNQFDVYYRAHSSEFGWLGWAKNGGNAGSEGYGRQMEAIEIKLVKKGGQAPGSTARAFVKK